MKIRNQPNSKPNKPGRKLSKLDGKPSSTGSKSAKPGRKSSGRKSSGPGRKSSGHGRKPSGPRVKLARAIRQKILKAIESHRDTIQSLRKLFAEMIRIDGLTILRYSSYKEFFSIVEQKLPEKYDMSYYYKLWDAAELDLELELPTGEVPESVLRPLVKLDTADRSKAWVRAKEKCGPDEYPTAKQVEEAIDEALPDSSSNGKKGAKKKGKEPHDIAYFRPRLSPMIREPSHQNYRQFLEYSDDIRNLCVDMHMSIAKNLVSKEDLLALLDPKPDVDKAPATRKKVGKKKVVRKKRPVHKKKVRKKKVPSNWRSGPSS